MSIPEPHVELRDHEGFPVLEFHVFFDGQRLGPEVTRLVDGVLAGKKDQIILDFTRCPIINSSALGVLMHLGTKVVDDCKGRLVLVGISKLQEELFLLAGVAVLADILPDLPRALASLRR